MKYLKLSLVLSLLMLVMTFGAYAISSSQHMTDEETDIFNYLLATEGEESAREYQEFIDEKLNFRSGEKIANDAPPRSVQLTAHTFFAGISRFFRTANQLFSREILPISGTEYVNILLCDNYVDYIQ